MADLQSKPCAVITGAGSGIGRAVTIALAARGWRLALLGRRPAELNHTLSLCESSADSLVVPTDISVANSVDRAFVQIDRSFGRIDLLFNNAGAFPSPVQFDEIELAEWRSIMAVNLDGAFLCAQAAFRRMRQQDPPGGRIINNGSLSAQVPRPAAAAYTVSKHAITGLTKSIIIDGRSLRILCSQIDIGNAATELVRNAALDALQADGSLKSEPMMDVANVAQSVALIAEMPLDVNIPFLTIMASQMPFSGRG